ncbi:hypothetical protein BJV82DRAFT_30689 [Fennellomyces sp. T-0311]|nr:hypothetical protein BJV82DRAFT_30689 [Fennellomyces sp. T-0311]
MPLRYFRLANEPVKKFGRHRIIGCTPLLRMPLQKDSKQSQSKSAPKVVVGRQLTLKDFVRKKRTRIRRSCDACRKRKIKCDSNVVRPCTGCRNSGDDCEFLLEARRPGPPSKEYLETLEDRLKRLEGLLSSQQTPANYHQAAQQSEPARANDTQPTSSQQATVTSSEIVTNTSNKGYVGVNTSNEGLYMLYDSLLQLSSAPGNLSWPFEGALDDGQKNKKLAISYPEKQRLIQSIPGFTEDLADKMIHA